MKGATHAQQIAEYVTRSSGLKAVRRSADELHIHQTADGKTLCLRLVDVEEVLFRKDGDSKTFLQINFLNGRKILVTDTLIGFKPVRCHDLDMDKLPRVVTTPDLISVVEAIEDTLSSENGSREELEVLKRVYEAVVKGAESVGFDLGRERIWLHSLSQSIFKASA